MRANLIRPLANALRRLHAVDVRAGVLASAPLDELRRADLRYRAEQIETLAPSTDLARDARALSERTPPAERLTLVHGDLYARHLLVTDAGDLAGIIDWGDIHIGDPALDLSIAFTHFPADERELFFSDYGGVSPDTRDRARFRGLFYSVILEEYGRSVGDAAIRKVAAVAREYALS
jgi:aminoglycoside phosphotransferase (APT) family kinase protein